jgi:hypothetical protein
MRVILQGSVSSVAGEAQEVASVMNKFVNHVAWDQGSGSLLGADEIEREQEKQSAEDEPRPQFAKGNDGKSGWFRNGADSGLQHIWISWDHASRLSACFRRERRSDFRPFDCKADHSGATVPELHRLHSFAVTG